MEGKLFIGRVPGRWKVFAENGNQTKRKTRQQVNTVQRPRVCTVATKPELEPWHSFIKTLSPTFTEAKLTLLTAQEADESERPGVEQGIRFYSESWLTKKTAN